MYLQLSECETIEIGRKLNVYQVRVDVVRKVSQTRDLSGQHLFFFIGDSK